MEEVRERTLEVLDEVELADTDDPLLGDGFVYEMLLAHEHQHNETMLQLLQMVDGYEPVELDPARRRPSRSPRARRWSRWSGGSTRSAPARTASPTTTSARATRSSWRPFGIDRTPVTNAAFAEFVADTGAEPPMYWERDGDGWVDHDDGRTAGRSTRRCRSIHVDWHQADAFARWAGKRLPTELEWEAAASGADRERANLDQLAFGCAPAGAYGDAAVRLRRGADARRRLGVDLLGLRRLPGLRGVPVSRVLGGVLRRRATRCCAAAPGRRAASVIRTSFRNWDLPERSQIFSGIRCVRDE